MSKLSLVLSADRIIVGCEVKSKKKALETISQLLTYSEITSEIDVHSLLSDFFEREKLGSMAIGHGVALPHIRLDDIDQPVGALLILDQPIIYDEQNEPIDILLGLLMPKGNTQENLAFLQHIAGYLKQTSLRQRLRQAEDSRYLYDELCKLK